MDCHLGKNLTIYTKNIKLLHMSVRMLGRGLKKSANEGIN